MRMDELYTRLVLKFGVKDVVNAENGRVNMVVRPKPGYVKVRVGDYGSGKRGLGRTKADTYSSIVAISRHFVTKPLYRIVAEDGDGKEISVITTNDHTCAVYNGVYGDIVDAFVSAGTEIADETWERYSPYELIEFKAAKDVRAGDKIPHCSDNDNGDGDGRYCRCDAAATVKSVEEIDNSDGRYVYDIEVESGRHVYYANGLLVHNSQFINLAPITHLKCREAGISESTRFSELPDCVRKAIIGEAYTILDIVNANVERLINENCHTTQGKVVHYSLEYIASEGFYFKPKHYIVHKIIEDDRPCNKFKYSGISVKKAEIPAEMKSFLKEIYEHTMTDDWFESDYVKKVEEAFNKYNTLDWGQLAFYKKYRTAKEAVSLTESEKGAGAHARAANIYNGLLKELGLGGKYPEISVGDEYRYSYVLPTNRYGVDVIGFKGEFPCEFREIFSPDYIKMFDKIFTSSLKNYVSIMGYERIDPSKRTENPDFDIF